MLPPNALKPDGNRGHAAALATGRMGGVPLASLSRQQREALKSHKPVKQNTERPHQGSKEVARRLRQLNRGTNHGS